MIDVVMDGGRSSRKFFVLDVVMDVVMDGGRAVFLKALVIVDAWMDVVMDGGPSS